MTQLKSAYVKIRVSIVNLEENKSQGSIRNIDFR